eukprot:6024341-Pyramimonas_sp.AAC.1
MNIIDHGTSFQQCALLSDDTAKSVWAAFLRWWVRPFGVPEVLVCDGGGEFEGIFARGCEHHGVMQH